MEKGNFLLNKYFIISFLILMIMFFVSWIMESNIIEMLFFFDVNAPDLLGNGVAVKEQLTIECFNPGIVVYDMFTLAGGLIPILTLVGMGNYFRAYDGYLKYYIGRGDYFKNMRKAILSNSIVIATYNFLAYFIILLILSRFSSEGKLYLNENVALNQFFDKDIFYNYQFMYFVVIGFTSVFLVSFVLAVLIGGLYSLLKSKLSVSIFIVVYTFIISLVGSIFGIKLINILLTIRSFDFFNSNFYEVLIPLIIPSVIGIILLFRKDIYEI